MAVRAYTPDLVKSLPVNPALSGTFPWLSGMAGLYEKYRFRKLEFEYVPTCPTNTNGEVCLAFDHDANDDAPRDMDHALSYQDSTAGVPWAPLKLKVSLATDKQLYTRVGTPGKVTDLKTMDIGNFSILLQGVTYGTPDGYQLGRLYAHYEIEFSIPQLELVVGGRMDAVTGMTAALPLGSSPTYDAQDQLPYRYDTTTGWLTFNQDFEGLLALGISGAGLGTPNMVVSIPSNAAGATYTTLLGSATAMLVNQCYAMLAPAGSQFRFYLSAATGIASALMTIGTAKYNSLV
jgi:hypothetical protein